MAGICYRCLQILMVSTLWMERALGGAIIIGLVLAGELYHWWYAWRMRRVAATAHEAGVARAWDDVVTTLQLPDAPDRSPPTFYQAEVNGERRVGRR